MAELKLCPFCGRIPMVEDCGDNRYFVRCKCGIAQDKLYGQRCDAVRRWNTRKPSAQGDAEFISWLLDEIWDDEMWELNYRAFPELLCRRLVKAGWLKEEGGKYVRLDKQTGGD